MNLYTVHHPDDESEYEYWEAVWSDSHEQAITLYVDHYRVQCDWAMTPEEFAATCKCTLVEGHGETPSETEPHFEGRRSVLRNIGFRCDGDTMCENCERYSMDEDDWRVCEECEQCAECGHDADCPEKESVTT